MYNSQILLECYTIIQSLFGIEKAKRLRKNEDEEWVHAHDVIKLFRTILN